MGLTARIIQQRIQPSAAGYPIQGGDLVRFLINMAGYWDPYRAFMNIQVDFSVLENWVVAQLDNSAASFFRSMVIYRGGEEVERIMEMDILVAILMDM